MWGEQVPVNEKGRVCPLVILYYIKRATTPQVQSQFCPNESHCRLGTKSQSLGVTGDELHDGAERGPVDRDGARRTKS